MKPLSLLIMSTVLVGCGRFLASYDLSVETRVPAPISTRVQFGEYRFLTGTFSGGRSIEVGATAWITDTAILHWASGLDQKKRDKAFRIGWLPWRWPNQKYHFLFTIYPGDSATLETQVLKKNDCSHIEGRGKVAYVGSSPCSW